MYDWCMTYDTFWGGTIYNLSGRKYHIYTCVVYHDIKSKTVLDQCKKLGSLCIWMVMVSYAIYKHLQATKAPTWEPVNYHSVFIISAESIYRD